MDFVELKHKIEEIKREKGAIILAHNYQLPEVQDIADFTGDSLELARKAANIDNDIIVFCGVYFMAETASILNPEKNVLIPDIEAGCPLADFATGQQVREWRNRYPDYTFVAYINTTAEVKAEIDMCCTSSNALKVVESVDNDKIVFLPDRNLASYVQRFTKKEIVCWPGYCIVHQFASLPAILETKEKYPDAITMAHPECPSEILDIADEICSTGQMFQVVEKYKDKERFIVVTEWGMNYALSRKFPDKVFIEPAKRMQCANMKKITLQKVYDVLRNENNRVSVESGIADRAKDVIMKMLAL
jgi:quinolinate synthase